MLSKSSRNNEKNRDFASQRILKSRHFLRLKDQYNEAKAKYPGLPAILQKSELFLPDFIFSKKLSSLEAISKYLIENCKLSINDASKILNRTNKNIWFAYNSSRKKLRVFEEKKVKFVIPTKIFGNLELSVLENIVAYLKDELGLKYCEIAVSLKRDQRTIWAVYNKAAKVKKQENKEVKKYTDIADAYIKFYSLSKKFSRGLILTKLQNQVFIPVGIFSKKLGSFESIIKFLVENCSLNISEIADLLDRSYPDIWKTYAVGRKKFPGRFAIKHSTSIPLSILRGKKFGVLENIVVHLKDFGGFSYHKISVMIARDEKTVWTTYQKAKKKIKENEL